MTAAASAIVAALVSATVGGAAATVSADVVARVDPATARLTSSAADSTAVIGIQRRRNDMDPPGVQVPDNNPQIDRNRGTSTCHSKKLASARIAATPIALMVRARRDDHGGVQNVRVVLSG